MNPYRFGALVLLPALGCCTHVARSGLSGDPFQAAFTANCSTPACQAHFTPQAVRKIQMTLVRKMNKISEIRKNISRISNLPDSSQKLRRIDVLQKNLDSLNGQISEDIISVAGQYNLNAADRQVLSRIGNDYMGGRFDSSVLRNGLASPVRSGLNTIPVRYFYGASGAQVASTGLITIAVSAAAVTLTRNGNSVSPR